MNCNQIEFDYTKEEQNSINQIFSEQINSISKCKDIPYVNTLKERIELRNRYMKEGKSYEEIEQLIYERYKFDKNNFYHLVKDVRITLLFFLNKLDIIKKCKVIDDIVNNEEIMEKIYIRYILIKNRFTYQSIEKIICRYYNSSFVDSVYLKNLYSLLNILINFRTLNNDNLKIPVGRRKIPEEIQIIINQKNNNKRKEYIKKKYNIFNLVNDRDISIEDLNEIRDIINKNYKTSNNEKIKDKFFKMLDMMIELRL